MSTSKSAQPGEISLRRGTKPRRRPSGLYLPKARSRVTNGTGLLPNIDQRSVWCRRFRDIIALHVQDLGGLDLVSAAEASLVRRIACITLECERLESLFGEAGGASEHKIEVYARLSANLRRLLETIGLKRVHRDVTPTLEQYLQGPDRMEAAE